MDARNETMWCTVCGARFTEAEIKGWGCPKCKNQGTPCGTKGDVLVEVNWHELHILTCWAERHAHTDPDSDMPRVVTAISRRLQAQFPEMPPLTLAQEISELPTKMSDFGMGITGVTTNIPRPIPIPVNGPGAVGHSRSSTRLTKG